MLGESMSGTAGGRHLLVQNHVIGSVPTSSVRNTCQSQKTQKVSAYSKQQRRKKANQAHTLIFRYYSSRPSSKLSQDIKTD